MSLYDIYIIENQKVAFTDYDELIRFVRRNKLSGVYIYSTRANSWNEMEEETDITEQVWLDAYNDFDHYKDMNYPYVDREIMMIYKGLGIPIYG